MKTLVLVAVMMGMAVLAGCEGQNMHYKDVGTGPRCGKCPTMKAASTQACATQAGMQGGMCCRMRAAEAKAP